MDKPKVVELYKNEEYALCGECPKNGKECPIGAELCLPLEMLKQLSEEPSIMSKLIMLDNISSYF